MKKFIIVTLLILLCVFLAVAALLKTTAGSKFVLHQTIFHFSEHEHGALGVIKGNILSGITLENFELTHIEGLPQGSTLRIQKLYINGSRILSGEFIIDVENARLRIQSSDPIVLNGSLRNKELNFNLFGPGVGINEIKDFLDLDWLKPYSGTVTDIDFTITGSVDEPKINGDVYVEELHRKTLSLYQVPLTFDITLKKKGFSYQVLGTVSTQSGWLQSRKTKVALKESRVTFQKRLEDLELNLKGEAKIDKVPIVIRITGTKNKPDIHLSSQPPLPRETLLVMLATGKRWTSVETSLINQSLSPEITSDFIDFFLFDGPGDKLARKFGLKDINVTYGQGKQGIGLSKTITSKIDVGYGIEKTNATPTRNGKTTQTLDGQLKVTDKVSLELEKKLETQDQTNSLENGANKVQSDDKVMLKFRTNF